MKLQFKAGPLEKTAENSAVFLYEAPDLKKRPELKNFAKAILPLLKDGAFKGSFLAELPLKTEKGWLFLIGLGDMEALSPARLSEAAATASKMALARNIAAFDFILPPAAKIPAGDVLDTCALGALLSLYRQTEFKSESPLALSLKSIAFLATEDIKNGAAKISRAKTAAEAVTLARRLGDAPPGAMYPEIFAREAVSLAKALKLKAVVFDEKALAREKMGLILAVGRGSHNPPRLVTLHYKGGRAGQKPVVLVGKGITFDSGGLSLKPPAGMEGMKTDMAGAAAVLAAIRAAAALKLPLNISAVMPLADNLPDGKAMRVGDVVRTRAGLNVEITNTDAEGRLVLAEALTWAAEMAPSLIIDAATLTGAAKAALGDSCAAVFANDDGLSRRLMEAAASEGEGLWPLPLLDEYEDALRSQTADIINCPAAPSGRAIMAALFLRRFVKNLPWAHLDIAGPARTDKARAGAPIGASGFAVRTLLRFLEKEAGQR